MWRLFLIALLSLVVAQGGIPSPRPVSAFDDGHLPANYFVLPFIEALTPASPLTPDPSPSRGRGASLDEQD